MTTKEKKLPNTVKFSFFISDENKKLINQFIYTKIVQGHLKFTLTDAICEGLVILQKKNPIIPERKNTNRRYKRGAHKSPVNGKKNSIIIDILVYEWIENYISFRIERDILYTTSFFINDLISAIKIKYKDKLLVVPEL